MKTGQEIMEIVIEESREEEETMKYSKFLKKKWYSEDEIITALDILPCEELKDECLERMGIIRGLEK